jgi:transcriptional regulator with XRE-family HTH domain
VPTRAAARGRALGRRLVQDTCREIDRAAADRGLSYAAIARAVGLSRPYVGRICRGLVPDVTLVRLAEIATVVGLDLATRAYPGGPPLRDRAHVALLERFRTRLARSLRWKTEVPVIPIAGSGDRRAWDATVGAAGWIAGVEAETHVTDLQALERRIALKRRDGEVDVVLVLLSDTRHHRLLVDSVVGATGFKTPARGALRALGRGERPPGDAVIRL